MALLRMSPAAERVGLTSDTLREWAIAGKVPFSWVGRERRFNTVDLDALKVSSVAAPPVVRREALYVRVSGSSGQETSLVGQEQELRESASGEVVTVFKDRASGLRENRPGLTRLLKAATENKFTVVRVSHPDRLARFGQGWIEALLACHGVSVEVLHPKSNAGGMDELLADFVSLVATFAGRMYGIRSKENRVRLLTQARAALDTAGGDSAEA